MELIKRYDGVNVDEWEVNESNAVGMSGQECKVRDPVSKGNGEERDDHGDTAISFCSAICGPEE